MAKAIFETGPDLNPEPFRPAAEEGDGTILFGTPYTAPHNIPGHWVTYPDGNKDFFPDADHVQRKRGEDTPEQ